MDDAIARDGVKAREHAHGTRSILAKIQALPGDRVTFADIARVLGDQGVALSLLIFALPNCIPAPPGLGSILGIPLFIAAVCLLRGTPLWLPGFIARRSAAKADLIRILSAAIGWMEPLERRMKPRLLGLVSPTAERFLAIYVMVLSLVIALPFPLTNLVPAIGTALISLGLTERDGLVVAAGLVVGAIGVVLAGSVLAAFVVAPFMILTH